MLKHLKLKSEFSRNVLTLMTGTTIAQAIPIAISPILTRIYTPADFGMFALYMSAASLLSIIATGRYELAIMLPRKNEDAINIVALSIIVTLLIAFVSLLIIVFFHIEIATLLGDPHLSKWLYFIPLTILFTGLYQSFNYWLNRHEHYKDIATNRVMQMTTTATTNLAMGFSKIDGGLIFGNVIGQMFSVGFLYQKFKPLAHKYFPNISKLKIIALSRKYKKLPLYNLPNAFIDTIRVAGINILIAKFFLSSTLGQFSLAWKMVQAPMSIIGSSISQVFFQKISNAKKSELEGIVKRFTIKTFLIALPLFLFLYFFAEDIFSFVFGSNWKLAGEITSVLTPWLFLNFITSPLSSIFITINKQEILLVFSIVYMTVPLGILYFFHHLSITTLMLLLSLSMSVQLLIFIALVFHVVKKV